MNELLKLKKMLEEANIPFETTTICGDKDDQIIIISAKGKRLCDVIYHKYSYGYEEDLLEIMDGLTEEEYEYDGVLGCLTAEEVFKRFKYCYENNTKVYGENE